jgi:hypothetical protein
MIPDDALELIAGSRRRIAQVGMSRPGHLPNPSEALTALLDGLVS